MHPMTQMQISHNIITTVKMNNINNLTAVHCSARKPCMLVFMRMMQTIQPNQAHSPNSKDIGTPVPRTICATTNTQHCRGRAQEKWRRTTVWNMAWKYPRSKLDWAICNMPEQLKDYGPCSTADMRAFILTRLSQWVKEHPRQEHYSVALISVLSFCSVNIVAIKQLFKVFLHYSDGHHCPAVEGKSFQKQQATVHYLATDRS